MGIRGLRGVRVDAPPAPAFLGVLRGVVRPGSFLRDLVGFCYIARSGLDTVDTIGEVHLIGEEGAVGVGQAGL